MPKANAPTGSHANAEFAAKVVCMSEEPQDIDVGQLMEVICGYRKERYRFERIVSLMTFSGWLRWPKDTEILRRSGSSPQRTSLPLLTGGFSKYPRPNASE
jgi:hypothetical protein